MASEEREQQHDEEEVKVGDVLPNVELRELVAAGDDKPRTVKLLDLLRGKGRVVVFGVPGAFTPGCSQSHLPSFIEAQEELTSDKYQVVLTVCVATNDAYTMEAWGRSSGGIDAGIRFLADDTGALTRALGLVKQTPVGIRTKRFSLVADGSTGKVTHYFSSKDGSSNTWAPSVLSAL